MRVRAEAPANGFARWEQQYDFLAKKGLKSVSPEEAKALCDQGDWVIVDVRPTNIYNQVSSY